MANITVKLFASLGEYLPPEAKDNAILLALPKDGTVSAAIDELKVPPERCHLVLLNGIFVPPGQRASEALADGDTVAIWPPVAGG